MGHLPAVFRAATTSSVGARCSGVDDTDDLEKIIRNLGDERGLTLDQLADRAQIGRKTLMSAIRRARKPKISTVERIAIALEVDAFELREIFGV